MALKRHFTSWDYDYEQFNGKVRLNPDKFDTHKDRFRYEKLSKHRTPRWLMIAALVKDPTTWLGDVINDEHERLAAERLKNSQSLTYTVRQEFKPEYVGEGLVRDFLGGRVSPETFSVLACMAGMPNTWRGDDPVMDMLAMKAVKYHTFLKYDRKKIAQIVIDKCSEVSV